jgi:CheY-like chemotaxis protein
VVGVAGDAEDLLRKAGAHHPDVVITDIQMPPNLADDGLRAAQASRQSSEAWPPAGARAPPARARRHEVPSTLRE